jgi:hypothetical protein
VVQPVKTYVSTVARLVTGRPIVVLEAEDDLDLDLGPSTGLEAVEVTTVAPESSVRVFASFAVSMGISRRTALTGAVVALLADTETREADRLRATGTTDMDVTTDETVAVITPRPGATRPDGLLPTPDPHPEDTTAVKTLAPHHLATTADET